MSDLQDRPRLMALVFALRLTGLSFALSMGGIVLLYAGVTATREAESMVLLFTYFLFLISLVLAIVRFGERRNQILALSPVLVFLMPSSAAQLLAAWLFTILFLQAFCMESRPYNCHLPFRFCQSVVFFSGAVLGLLSPQVLPVASLVFLFSLFAVFSSAAWRWQQRIRTTLHSLDLDE